MTGGRLIGEAALGEARRREVSGRSTSKDVAGVEAHLDHVGLVNMGQGFTRKPKTMAEKSSATLRIARHWAAQLDVGAREPAASSGRSPSRLMHLQKELRAGLIVTGKRWQRGEPRHYEQLHKA